MSTRDCARQRPSDEPLARSAINCGSASCCPRRELDVEGDLAVAPKAATVPATVRRRLSRSGLTSLLSGVRVP